MSEKNWDKREKHGETLTDCATCGLKVKKKIGAEKDTSNNP